MTIINNIENLTTIDVWDTLLRRKCHPEAIKYQLARTISLKYYEHLRQNYLSANDIYFQRLAIERKIAKETQKLGFDDEYSLAEVLRDLMVTITKLKGDDLTTSVEFLIECEINLEKSNTYPDPSIKEFVGDLSNGEIHYLSDFYMASSQLEKILEHHKINQWVSCGYVSCDYKYNKRSGRLFPKIQNHLDRPSYKNWQHFGDNLHSDFEQPTKLGIAGRHYYNQAEEDKRTQNCKAFESKDQAINELKKIVTHTKNPSLDLYGHAIAPLIAGFCEFIIDKKHQTNCDQIIFITREGEFLSQVFTTYIANSSDYYKSLETQVAVLGCSRFSLMQCSSFNAATQNTIWRQYGIRGAGRFLIQLGCSAKLAQSLTAKYNLEFDEIIANPSTDKRINDLCNDSEFVRMNLEKTTEQNENFREYFQLIMPQGIKNALIVDVGWNGTCQDILSKLITDITFHGAYLGLKMQASENSYETKAGFLFTQDTQQKPHELERFSEVFEVLLSTSNAPVIGYEKIGNNVSVARDPNYQNSQHDQQLGEFQAGLIAGVKHTARIVANSQLNKDDLRKLGSHQFLTIFTDPPVAVSDIYFKTPRHDIFRESTYSDRSQLPKISLLLRSLLNAKEREKVIFYFRSVQWIEGSKNILRNEPFIVRLVYRPLFLLAKTIKTLIK